MSASWPEPVDHVLLAPESVTGVRQEEDRSCFTEEVQEQPLDEPGSPGRVGRGSAVSAGTKKRVLMVIWRNRPQTTGAAVLSCRDGWIGYRGICYYISREEASWESSQRHCSLLGASLAVLKREWEVPFLMRLKGSANHWLGLRRQDGRLVWVDDTVYKETFPVHGQGACAYMSDAGIASSSCSQLRPYICSVALAPIGLL
ncbi:C-type lectin domain family 2 member B-like isoform X4 [Apteryx mantelli]|uniref:C-type lectin domain family 2 member B-like isoform X4 n=1 Tax=Apteryx mantelli TaxID=2696672 RepID=A0ABM4FYA4_9AVES